MHLHRRSSLFFVAALVAGALTVAQVQAQSGAPLTSLMKQRDASLHQLQATADAQKADLFNKYANALDTLTRQFSAKGDLDSLLIVKTEIETALTKRAVGEAAFPALDVYRATLRKNLAVIDGTTAKSQAQMDAGYLRTLNQMKSDLTRAGKLDDAIAVDKEIKNVNAGTAPAVGTGTTPKPATETPRTAKSAKPVAFDKPFVEEVTIPAGSYQVPEGVTIGGDVPDKKDVPGTLHLVKGTAFDNTTIFCRKGLVTAERVFFKGSTLMADFKGSIRAKDCVFSECTIKKGGNTGTDFFASKWSFDNCVFTGKCFPDWRLKLVGVQITHCTFHNVEFGTPGYVKDAGEEVAEEWFSIRDCRFVGCVISDNLLIATKDCVFENCQFQPASQNLTAPILTPIKLRAYVSDRATAPAAPAKVTYDILDASRALKKAGASLDYTIDGKALILK